MLDGQEIRKTAEICAEDGRKERHFVYLDGETISGKVSAKFFLLSSVVPTALSSVCVYVVISENET